MILHLDVITPVKTLYSAPIRLVTVPGLNGSFTLLNDHAPIISILTKGVVTAVGQDGSEHIFECLRGVIECKANKVVVLIENS